MAISRRKAMGLVGGTVAGLGVAAFALNRQLNPHTPLGYALPQGPNARLATPPCDDEPTPSVTEGPFYTPNTPERISLREPGIVGTPLLLAGRVLATDCTPIAGAVLDFWSCDGNGVYDNEGFRLRGHQFTDAEGRFRLESVKPGAYRQYGVQRTPHIHVKVQGRGTPLLTTQLFFPGEPLNRGDWLMKNELLVDLRRPGDGSLLAGFDFVLPRTLT